LGFRVQETPTDAAKLEFCAPHRASPAIPELGPGAPGVQWFAVQNTEKQPKVLLFEHQYTIGSGKSTVEFTRTLIAWPAGHPDISFAVLPQLSWFTRGGTPGFSGDSKKRR
jgi:hypothetical protein